MLSRGGWPNALDFSLVMELNIPRMYYLMNNSFMECFFHYLMNSKCTCVRSTTLDNFALDQTTLDKKQSSRLSLNKVAKRFRHFTQNECRALYSEKWRAFGQGLALMYRVDYLVLGPGQTHLINISSNICKTNTT